MNESTQTATKSRRTTKARKNGRRSGASRHTGKNRTRRVDVRDVFRRELLDVNDAEAQIDKFLPKASREVQHPRLERLLEELRSQAEAHQRKVGRVVEAYLHEGRKSNGKRSVKCEAMRSLVKEADKNLRSSDASQERDLVLITELQKMWHYTIATYGSLCSWSDRIGDPDASILFRRITDEKKLADRELTRFAEEEL